jgi:hypothetical protein
MTPALALEALMLHPAYPQLVEQWRAVAPTGLVDQADAAALDAHRGMRRAAAAGHYGTDTVAPLDADDLPGWLRLGLLDTAARYATGQARTCRHNPTPGRPQPVMAAAWSPGLVVCTGCTHLLSIRHDATADATCDACGRVCAGPEHGDGVWPGMVQLGPLIYQYGTCASCRLSTTTAGPLNATQTTEQPRPGVRAEPARVAAVDSPAGGVPAGDRPLPGSSGPRAHGTPRHPRRAADHRYRPGRTHHHATRS